jgi:hypothetical protein
MRTGSGTGGGEPAAPASSVRPGPDAGREEGSQAARRARLVDEQRHAAALVREAAATVRAPAHLRAWLAAWIGDQAGLPSTRLATRRRPR